MAIGRHKHMHPCMSMLLYWMHAAAPAALHDKPRIQGCWCVLLGCAEGAAGLCPECAVPTRCWRAQARTFCPDCYRHDDDR
eukprot:355979-Chlamydomonas_euryale.AAC.2